MNTLSVQFTPKEKEFLTTGIVANALAESKCFDRKGYEFEFTNNHFPFLKHLVLNCNVWLSEDVKHNAKPDPDQVLSRSVHTLTPFITDGNGDEVNSNLDFNFKESVIKDLQSV